jgi:hypothetical protein
MTQLADLQVSEPVPAGREDGGLADVLRGVQIVADDTYRIQGSEVKVGRAARSALPGQAAHADPLVESLRSDLYRLAYAARFGAGPPNEEAASEADDYEVVTAFAASLSAANRSRERWDAGWTIQSIRPDGSVAAAKGDRVRLFHPGEYHVPGLRGAVPGPGMAIRARAERESQVVQPGYYFAFGEEIGDAEDDQSLLRFYWNVGPAGAAPLIGELTGSLNRFQLPFRLKCPLYPPAYARIDAAVLYVARRYYELASELVADVHASVAEHLDDEVPLFTLPLARGLSLAEDPGGAESFGTHRCRLLAEALVEAHRAGETDVPDRMDRVRQVFDRNGLDFERPWLGSRSRRDYRFPALRGEP